MGQIHRSLGTGVSQAVEEPYRHVGLWTWLSVLPFVLWPLYCIVFLGERRWEVITLMITVPALAFAHPTTRKLLAGLYPIGLVGLLYDVMRFVQNVGLREDTIHVCDLRAIEIGLFGIWWNGERVSVHDWLQSHANLFLDALCAFPYGTFLYASVGLAIYLYRKDFVALRRFAWSFFFLNLAGFITYHIYPAAPPWYYHSHGCLVQLHAVASEGPNLARIDALLGMEYFRGFYGRSHDVFGAVPSLHVAYPLLIVIEGWPYLKRLRWGTLGYFLLMCFAAVYLDHHWVVDVALGLGYTVVIHSAVRLFFRWHSASALAPTALPQPIESSES